MILHLTIREQKLMQQILDEAADMVSSTLLNTCLDLEYRLSFLELGLNETE